MKFENVYDYVEDVFRETFVSPFEQYKERRGEPFTVVEKIPAEKATPDFEYPVPLYRIQFADGEVIEAWPEEVCVPAEGTYMPDWAK